MRSNQTGHMKEDARDMGCSVGPTPPDCTREANGLYQSAPCREMTALELLADLRTRLDVASESIDRTRFAVNSLATKLEREHESAVRRAEGELHALKAGER